MTDAIRRRLIRPTRVTWLAIAATVAIIVACGAGLLAIYSALPDILPVHFNARSRANGWQYKNHARVLMPVLVQLALAAVFGAVSVLLLSRPHGKHDEQAPDIRTASTAVEAIALVALIWVAFQAYAAVALVSMWQRGRGGLGDWYTMVVGTGAALSIIVATRAHVKFGTPGRREFVAAHWRFGQLYKNPDDPALFVPTRDGSRWTLNFGRPVAAALLGLVLAVGITIPTAILALLLR